MKLGEAPLQLKILFGYLILMAVIGSMAAILLYERQRMREIEAETREIRTVRREINLAHRYITELATYGESVIAWENPDYDRYHQKRLSADSILYTMKQKYNDFIHPDQIETLRKLLEDKETHLLHIMEAIKRQKETDSFLVTHLPEAAKRATQIRTVLRKKSGFAGKVLGKKEKIYIVPSTRELQALNDSLKTMYEEQMQEMDTYVDSLRMQNKELNRKLHAVIASLDVQAQNGFTSRETKIEKAQAMSYRLFAFVISTAILLLLVSFLIIRQDIRKENRIRKRLKQTIQENEELLDMRKKIILTVSHDIRGPIGNINNCAELASDTRERKKRETYLENIRHSCRHILRLVNDLMDVYKINEAKDTKNEIPFQLDRFLERISQEYTHKANSKGLIFEAEHRQANVTVKGDADKLEQVIDNLLGNAIKFTPTGSVTFRSSYQDGRLHIDVADTGIGMDQETLERIFRPFERAAQDVNSEGFGLGLFITKGLLGVLGGTIRTESQCGKGTVFHLSLPLPETTEGSEPEEIQVQEVGVLPRNVLVVDDDAILLKIAEDMFGRNGVRCTSCSNVQEAVKALRQTDYDLVLTDIQMPGTDGFGLLKLLRNSNIGCSRTVPVAAMTSRGDGHTGIYEEAGFCGCLHKPFSMKGLMAFAASVTIPNSLFDYERLLEHTDDRKQMFRIIVEESRKDLCELEGALPDANRGTMRQVVHRMLPVWEMLGADHILLGYRQALHNEKNDDETVREHTSKVICAIKKLIEECEQKKRHCNEK
ncbi:response regulator [Bacteroides gallinaceum]|uniref:hybrid sensor histidine kinase/response regulator n=1 Tax=Bacteroides gallinaceum TaxID=1462571 RepID=UPI0019561149|nr:hybrid sensor histidine kinase/response regulator [Bacteroides gallinaceum]MBM6719018.1 response regulator [Bacteroides gallinaceum]